jgi:hypothetical protein
MYSPNFGAYQGEGDYTTQPFCTYNDGVIKNARIYGFPLNGA